MKVRRIPLDLRHEEVVLELLDPEIQDERRRGRLDAGGGREQDGRDRREDRPDDRQELEDAGQDGEQHGEPREDRIDRFTEDDQPDEGPDPHHQAEQELPADP